MTDALRMPRGLPRGNLASSGSRAAELKAKPLGQARGLMPRAQRGSGSASYDRAFTFLDFFNLFITTTPEKQIKIISFGELAARFTNVDIMTGCDNL